MSPYDRSRSLSCFTVLLIVPKNWRLLLLSEELSVKMCFIMSGMSPLQSSHAWGCSLSKLCPCISLLWHNDNPVKHLSHWRILQTVFGNMYYLFLSVFNQRCWGADHTCIDRCAPFSVYLTTILMWNHYFFIKLFFIVNLTFVRR